MSGVYFGAEWYLSFQVLSQQRPGSPVPSPQHSWPPPARCRERLIPMESIRGIQPPSQAHAISLVFSPRPPLGEARLHRPSNLFHRGHFSLVFFLRIFSSSLNPASSIPLSHPLYLREKCHFFIKADFYFDL